MSDVIEQGCEVLMNFTLALADGTVAESSEEGGSLRFVIGDGTLDTGLEALLVDMRAGDKARFNLAPGQAFGEPDPTNVHNMPRSEFPADMALQEGAVVEFTTPAGDAVPGTVLALAEDSVTVDFNHPLAGRQLSFEVEILEVNSG